MMDRTRLLSLTFCALLLTAPLVGMKGFASPQPKAPVTEKPNPFPLNLFAQAKPSDYVDEKKCMSCHERPDNPMERAFSSFQSSPHRPFVEDPSLPVDKRGCQGCHGPGSGHLAHVASDDALTYIFSYANASPKEVALACLRCHDDVMTVRHWDRTAHARGKVSCISCHSIHQDGHPKDFTATGKAPKGPIFIAAAEPRRLLKADQATLCGSCHTREVNQFRQNFHHPVPEGRMVCSDCHLVHPQSAGTKADADPRSTNQAETIGMYSNRQACVSCHAEVAGPFVYQHDPAEGLTGEACLECHNPHGSQNPKMLKLFSRGLCTQCHSEMMTSHNPGQTCWQSGCHVGIHGSDHSVNLLTR